MRHFVEAAFLKHWGSSLLLLCAVQLAAQDIPVGTWRTHFSYGSAQVLEQTSDKVFCASQNGLFSIDITTGERRKLSKIDGLSDVGVSAMAYSEAENLLVIGYRSGFADFVFEDRIVSVTEIANSSLDGGKRINGIAFSNGGTYLATDLGIVVIRTDGVEIMENFVQIGQSGAEVEVKDIEVLNNVLYVKTNGGIQSGNLSQNLLDFNNWTHYPVSENYENLTIANGSIFSTQGINLLQLVATSWSDTGLELPAGSFRLFESNGDLLTASSQAVFQFSETDFSQIALINGSSVNDLLLVDSEYWIADDTLGLVSSNGNSLSPDGPMSDQYLRIKVLDGSAFGFHAPNPETYDGSEQISGFSIFDAGLWSVEEIANFQNVSDISVFEGNRYFSSIGYGLYDEANKEIITDIPGSDAEQDTVISALENGEALWVASYDSQDPIHQFDGQEWRSYSSTEVLGNQFINIALSEREILWATRSGGSIVTFDAEDGRVLSLSGLPGAVLDIELSIEDDAWVATSDGPVNYSNASFIFESNEAVRPSFENRLLFEDEAVNAVETDGGNRVWFATDRGLWTFDERISEFVSLFNEENSPLPSNRVLQLAYDGASGEMFVLTDQGLVSYRSSSSVGSFEHGNVEIFPNPVEPGYAGLVGIKGLAKNATIKVTDVNGNLVQELEANGGSASWNLRNARNGQVVTGIYLLFSATSDGLETYIGKIAVIR